jgi:hypothetical protein
MLLKIQYSGGYSSLVDSQFLSSLDSLGNYLTAQFHSDEYSLKCEFIEIHFTSTPQVSLSC